MPFHLTCVDRDCNHSFIGSEDDVGREIPCPRCGRGRVVVADGPDDTADFHRPRARAAAGETTLIGRTLLDRFRVDEVLGGGGCGQVYKAFDLLLQRAVAVKLPAPGLVGDVQVHQRFRREACAAAGVSHPNLCALHDFRRTKSLRFLVMEYLEGPPLSRYLSEAPGPLAVADAARIVSGLARAMEVAHQRGIVHRDLKPENVIMHPRRGPVIVDLGLARFDGSGVALSTQQGQAVGTLYYMAPEQVLGEKSAIGPRTDIYALGVVLYQLLTGRVPHEASSQYEVMNKICKEDPAPPSELRAEVPDELERICLRAMRREVASRHASMDELAAALDDYLGLRADPFAPTRPAQLICDNAQLIVFCGCPPGSFAMGSPAHEAGRGADEAQARVVITRGFWLGRYPVTQEQYRSLIGVNPSHFSAGGEGRDRLGEAERPGRWPVERVSWRQAARFCERLTERERRAGRLPANWEYRLPTEAQWEYACRAGRVTATAFGDELDAARANFDGAQPYNLTGAGPARGQPTEVGSFPRNGWGLHDMHGNVWEWCRDAYAAELPGGDDPESVGDGPAVLRGGGWPDPGARCRSAARSHESRDALRPDVGFRVAAVRID